MITYFRWLLKHLKLKRYYIMITYSSWLLRSGLPGRPSAWQLTARHPPPTLTEAIYLLFTFALIFLFLFFNSVFPFSISYSPVFCFKLFSNHQIDCPWKIYCQCDTFKCYLDLVLALFVYVCNIPCAPFASTEAYVLE